MFSVMLVLDYDYREKGPPSNLEPITVIKSDGGHANLNVRFLCISILEHADPPLLSELEESIIRHLFNIQFLPSKDTYFYTHVP